MGNPDRPEVFESGAAWAEGRRTPSEFPPAPPPKSRFKQGVLLGKGSMGRVHELVDRRLQRSIAKKELATRTAETALVAARLDREAIITAQLEHPGIVPVYDAGEDELGRPWYTMRLVRGRSLGQALHDAKELRERLALMRRMVDVAQTVAFAHGKGVVHRDLKPENIMLGEYGETLVMDWGLARRLDESVFDDPAITDQPVPPILTGVGDVVGTPAYMSPEQAFGETASTRADVWSIGAMLYEILTGHRLVALDDPNAALAALRAGRVHADDLPNLASAAPQELVAIARRALAPDPEERYPTAKELADDLVDFYDGNLVGAHVYTPLEHIQRILAANRRIVALGLASFLALLATITVAYLRVDGERRRALAAESSTQEALELANERLGLVLARGAFEAALGGDLPEAALLTAESLQRHPTPSARGVLMAVAGATPRLLERDELPPGCVFPLSDGDQRYCLGADSVRRLAPGEWRRELTTPTEFVSTRIQDDAALAVLADHGDRLRWLARSDGATLRQLQLSLPISRLRGAGRALWAHRERGIWRAWDGRELDPIEPKEDQTIGAVGVSASGLLLAYTDDEGLHHGPFAGPFVRVSFDQSGTGARFATRAPVIVQALDWVSAESVMVGLRDGTLRRISVLDGKTIWEGTARGGVVESLAVRDGVVAVAPERGGVELWDAENGVYLARLPTGAGRRVAFVDRGLETTSAQERWRWSLDELTPRQYRVPGNVQCAQLSPDGRQLAVLHWPRDLSVFEVETGRLVAHRSWHKLELIHAAFSVDGSLLYVLGRERGSIDVFETREWQRLETLSWPLADAWPHRLGVFASGRLLVVSTGGLAVVYDPNGDPTVVDAELYGRDLAMAADGHTAWVLGDRGQVFALSDADLPVARPLFPATGARTLASAGADALVVGFADHFELRSLTNEVLSASGPSASPIVDVAATEDGAFIATAALDGTLDIHARDGGVRASFGAQTARLSHAFFASGRLWTSSWDGSVQPWSLAPLTENPSTLAEELRARSGLRSRDLGVHLEQDDRLLRE